MDVHTRRRELCWKGCYLIQSVPERSSASLPQAQWLNDKMQPDLGYIFKTES